MNASSSLLFSLAEIKKDSADECSARVQNRRNENNKKLSAAEKKNFFFLLLLKRRRCGCDNITTLPCGQKKRIGFFFNEIVHTSHFFIFPIFWLHLFFSLLHFVGRHFGPSLLFRFFFYFSIFFTVGKRVNYS
jgi:hypothetical protein